MEKEMEIRSLSDRDLDQLLKESDLLKNASAVVLASGVLLISRSFFEVKEEDRERLLALGGLTISGGYFLYEKFKKAGDSAIAAAKKRGLEYQGRFVRKINLNYPKDLLEAANIVNSKFRE